MYVGIDVGATVLEVAASEPAPALPTRVPNTPVGRATLVDALRALGPALVVCEATGNYHRPLLAALLAAGVPIAVTDPAQVAAFRTTQRGRHKTDRADAQLLARFAALYHDTLRRATPEEPDLARLRAIVGYRDGLRQRATALRNQRHAADWRGEPTVVGWIDEELAQLTARLAAVEAEIAAVLATRPETAILTSQVGIGVLTAAAILAYLPAGVLGNPKAAAAYAGLHPRQEQSGQRDRSRLSKQGCPELRRYLYLAALSAVRFDAELKAWHQHLRGRGKAPKCALCAVAHKLLTRLMARLRDARAAQTEEVLPMAA